MWDFAVKKALGSGWRGLAQHLVFCILYFVFCTLYSVFHICIVKKPQALDGTGRQLIVRSSTGEINYD